jgi:hypothetical protein
MPRSGSHRSHRFAASRDPDTLRRAANVTATRTNEDVVVRFVPRDVGHAFPTGDIFRRLRVEASVVGDPTSTRRAFLQRNTKTDGPDTRPFVNGGPAEVHLPVFGPGKALAWSVRYERVDHPISLRDTDAVISGSTEIADGTLPP